MAKNTIGMQSPSSYFLQSLPAAGPRSYCLPRIVLRSPSSSALSRPVRPLASLRWIDHRRLHDANEGNDSCSQQLVRTLLIDNYDSYTYNIYQELAVVNGVPPVVIFNDELTWEQICNYVYVENLFDNIVISPGPGSPTCPTDIGVCLQVLIHCKDIPILGVCLGHQSLGFACGAQIVQAPEPVHGRLSEIVHSGCSLFNGIPSGEKSGFKVMRYHSLVIAAESLPEELVPTAWTSSVRTLSLFDIKESDMSPGSFLNQTNKFQSIGDLSGDSEAAGLSDIGLLNDLERGKVIMGVMHSSRPHYGVQFHPESIATCYGRQIFQNFKQITIDHGLRTSLKETKVQDSARNTAGQRSSNVSGYPELSQMYFVDTQNGFNRSSKSLVENLRSRVIEEGMEALGISQVKITKEGEKSFIKQEENKRNILKGYFSPEK
ncbi:hypothetical protein HPP92_010186 [Vanilla planifolia]|uniref:anthranilate synthase n=1 Tax=Vanilla planifolia TaxID=51239 RepID=A0A835R8V8_VANPL|nr:hypothetical protein HPP92_010186 [Vanilla planifolia]